LESLLKIRDFSLVAHIARDDSNGKTTAKRATCKEKWVGGKEMKSACKEMPSFAFMAIFG